MRWAGPDRWQRRLTLVVGLLLGSCAYEPGVESWDPIDTAEVAAQLQNPTATFGEVRSDIDNLIDEVERRIAYLLDTGELLSETGELLRELDEEHSSGEPEPSSEPPAERGEEVQGTTFYLSVACPGEGVVPVTDFSEGRFRLESPTFQSLRDIGTLLRGSDLLFAFEDCDLPAVRLGGDVPARYQIEPAAFFLDLTRIQIDLRDESADDLDLFDGRSSVNDLGLPVLGVLFDLAPESGVLLSVSAMIGSDEDDYYVLRIVQGETDIAVVIEAADGFLACRYDENSDPRLECDAEVSDNE